jgi:glycosyltransferase involved in cell wall biosynthesis
MANWYRCLDVLSLPSWGEGFGLPLIEAQACGIPVVTTRHSAMRELCGAGWMVDGEPFWNYTHEAWWTKPSARSIETAWGRAYEARGRYSERAREFALGYDAWRVTEEHWLPLLAELGAA